MNLALEQCNSTVIAAVRRYKEKCPNRRVQNRQDLYTYHIQSMKFLIQNDAFSGREISQRFVQQSAENPTLAAVV
jgi:hypothetical protein